MNWKEQILDAFKEGKTIQSNHNTGVWRDFRSHNQIDQPNVNYGNKCNWRIKPGITSEDEREQLLKDCGRDDITPMMQAPEPWVAKHYSREEMLLFAGFCMGKRKINPSMSGSDLWEAWEQSFPGAGG